MIFSLLFFAVQRIKCREEEVEAQRGGLAGFHTATCYACQMLFERKIKHALVKWGLYSRALIQSILKYLK